MSGRRHEAESPQRPRTNIRTFDEAFIRNRQELAHDDKAVEAYTSGLYFYDPSFYPDILADKPIELPLTLLVP